MEEIREDDSLLALLAWWREAGVVDTLTATPIDWTARGDAAPGAGFAWPDRAGTSKGAAGRAAAPAGGRGETSRPMPREVPPRPSGGTWSSAPPPSRPPLPASPGGLPQAARGKEPAAVASAREAARSARSLEELERLLRDFEGCPLKATAKSLCFFRGSPQARLMVIGEAPGRDEDLAGKPFVGRAGQLLDRMLAAIGLGEADVHITNIVYWRPPGNRTPTPEEAQACRPFLERQIELTGAEFILTLGGPAAKAILDATDGIMRLRGRWREIGAGQRKLRVMPTLHPAYLLRQPDAKRQAWRDLLQLRAALD